MWPIWEECNLIDKSGIVRDIRELLSGFVTDGTQISITLKSPEFAEVFLDGEYFNTFDVKNRKFNERI